MKTAVKSRSMLRFERFLRQTLRLRVLFIFRLGVVVVFRPNGAGKWPGIDWGRLEWRWERSDDVTNGVDDVVG